MALRPNKVKRNFGFKNEELRPLALIYLADLKVAANLAPYTGFDPSVNTAWVGNFQTATDALKNIVPSAIVARANKELKASIDDLSKKSVEYGKVLSYWLNEVYKDKPLKVATFPIIAANEAMRSGDTEAMLHQIGTIITLLGQADHQAALAASAWPASNLTNYQALYDTVEDLNTRQENAKRLIPENTDSAMTLRNECYAYIQKIIKVNEIVFKQSNPQRFKANQLSTLLGQIRSQSASKPTPPATPPAA